MLKIPQNIKKIINKLEENGFEAYVVGGAVRDSLLGNTPQDYDVTTSCPPEKIVELFNKTIPTGIKHGTITVIMDAIPTEVTTYRIDGNYTDNRSPDSVTFTRNLKDDLSRRDFTVNALAFNEEKGLIDLFNGETDLNNKIIRTVGVPEKRFSEDALRILRAIRFASTLGFKIEEDTYNAAIKLAENLNSISGERIYTELTKAIMGQNCKILEDFINKGGLSCLKINKAINFNSINLLPNNMSLRLFAFLKLTDADFNTVAERLHFSNKLKQYLEKAFYIDSKLKYENKAHIKNILSYTQTEIFTDYLEYGSAVKNENTQSIKTALSEIIENNEPYKISMLEISGKDLEDLEFSGEVIGEKLKFLLEKCIEKPELNNRKTLIEILK